MNQLTSPYLLKKFGFNVWFSFKTLEVFWFKSCQFVRPVHRCLLFFNVLLCWFVLLLYVSSFNNKRKNKDLYWKRDNNNNVISQILIFIKYINDYKTAVDCALFNASFIIWPEFCSGWNELWSKSNSNIVLLPPWRSIWCDLLENSFSVITDQPFTLRQEMENLKIKWCLLVSCPYK